MDRLPGSRVQCHLAAPPRGDTDNWLVAVLNWTPIVRHNYRVGVPEAGFYASC
jgi:hypothetical protein